MIVIIIMAESYSMAHLILNQINVVTDDDRVDRHNLHWIYT